MDAATGCRGASSCARSPGSDSSLIRGRSGPSPFPIVKCAAMPVVTCIDDLREMAKKRVARAIFEYVDCGAYSEATLRANRADIEAIGLRQRVGIDVDKRSTKTTLLGREAAIPLALAPVGLLG